MREFIDKNIVMVKFIGILIGVFILIYFIWNITKIKFLLFVFSSIFIGLTITLYNILKNEKKFDHNYYLGITGCVIFMIVSGLLVVDLLML